MTAEARLRVCRPLWREQGVLCAGLGQPRGSGNKQGGQWSESIWKRSPTNLEDTGKAVSDNTRDWTVSSASIPRERGKNNVEMTRDEKEAPLSLPILK